MTRKWFVRPLATAAREEPDLLSPTPPLPPSRPPLSPDALAAGVSLSTWPPIRWRDPLRSPRSPRAPRGDRTTVTAVGVRPPVDLRQLAVVGSATDMPPPAPASPSAPASRRAPSWRGECARRRGGRVRSAGEWRGDGGAGDTADASDLAGESSPRPPSPSTSRGVASPPVKSLLYPPSSSTSSRPARSCGLLALPSPRS